MNVGRIEDADFDKIKAWALNPEASDLPARHKDIFERLDFADNLLRKYPVTKHVAELMQKKFAIKKSQAYKDIVWAKRLFNSTTRVDKEWWKQWIIEDIVTMMAIAKGRKAGMDENGRPVEAVDPDLKAWSMGHGNLIKILRLDQEELNLPDPEVLQQHNFYTIIQIGSQTIKMELTDFHKIPIADRRKLIQELDQPISEEIAFEMLKNSDGQDTDTE